MGHRSDQRSRHVITYQEILAAFFAGAGICALSIILRDSLGI